MKFRTLLSAAAAALFLSCLTSAAQPKVPDYIVFAGDTVRFDRADLRERMDRELIAFCYSHANSTLMIKRANRYFPQIEPLLKAAAVPDDLKYLMVIESNVDPKAVSSAGAAGFWQFMKETGKSFGLVVNTEVDERYNTEKATLAACRYLKQAYAKYHDWLTAAASYNAGQGSSSRRPLATCSASSPQRCTSRTPLHSVLLSAAKTSIPISLPGRRSKSAVPSTT